MAEWRSVHSVSTLFPVGDPDPKTVAILGAGLTGLTAAHRLSQRGHHVRLFELSDRTGGAIRTENTAGWLVEAGPNTLLTGDPALTTLLNEIGLAGACLPASSAAGHRYIVRRGQLIAAPLTPPAFVRSPLFSVGARIRALRELVCPPPGAHGRPQSRVLYPGPFWPAIR